LVGGLRCGFLLAIGSVFLDSQSHEAVVVSVTRSAGDEFGLYGMIAIERIDCLPIDRLNPLVAQAAASGFHALSRLQTEWQSGRNRFDQPGEAIFIATDDGLVVGICGLNRDPYLEDPAVGRVRHLYVDVDHRRNGIGSQLVRAVMGAATGRFTRLRLRTNSPDADGFYRSLGFMRFTAEPACSHQVVLEAESGIRIPIIIFF
jgi:GNAT superfamily N-acetyltransferase